MSSALGLWSYWAVIVLMMTGLYFVIQRDNLVKKMMGLNIFQVSVLMLYISMAKVRGGTAPILPMEAAEGGHDGKPSVEALGHAVQEGAEVLYANPLPHVLMLTAIVVGIATMALGLSLVVRIQEAYGTVEEDEIQAIELGRGTGP